LAIGSYAPNIVPADGNNAVEWFVELHFVTDAVPIGVHDGALCSLRKGLPIAHARMPERDNAQFRDKLSPLRVHRSSPNHG
jgi:hypothetical protein